MYVDAWWARQNVPSCYINGYFVVRSFVIAFQVCSKFHMRTVERSLFYGVPMNATRIPNWFFMYGQKASLIVGKNKFVQSCIKNESLHVIKNLTATTTTTSVFYLLYQKPDWCVHYAYFSSVAFFSVYSIRALLLCWCWHRVPQSRDFQN